MSKKKLSEQEKKARQEALKNESIEDRTIRVLNPRINKLRKQIITLTKAFNSPRYKLSMVQQEDLIEALDGDVTEFFNAIRKVKKETELEDIL